MQIMLKGRANFCKGPDSNYFTLCYGIEVSKGSVGKGEIQYFVCMCLIVTEQGRGVVHDNFNRKDPPFLSLEVLPHTHLLGSKCPPPEERRLSMPENGEKERKCLFKRYTDLE